MIFFVVAKKDQGSAILRGIQISDYLNQLGVNSKVVTIPEIPLNEINSLFVWVMSLIDSSIHRLARPLIH